MEKIIQIFEDTPSFTGLHSFGMSGKFLGKFRQVCNDQLCARQQIFIRLCDCLVRKLLYRKILHKFMVVYGITTKISIFVSYYISVKETAIDLIEIFTVRRNIVRKHKLWILALGRVRTKLECPYMSLNLKTKIQGLESL